MTSDKVTLVLRSLVHTLQSPLLHSILESANEDYASLSIAGTPVKLRKRDTLVTDSIIQDRVIDAVFFNDMFHAVATFRSKKLTPIVNVNLMFDNRVVKTFLYDINAGQLS